MKYFETFNFDIIAVLVLVASVLLGFYHSLYRQARKTIVIAAPSVILYFTFNGLDRFFDSIAFVTRIRNSISSFVARFLGLQEQTELINSLILYIVLYVIIGFTLRFLYGIIRVPAYKKVLNNPALSSRMLGGLLGLISGYIIIMMLMFVSYPVFRIDYRHPLSKALMETGNEVVSFTKLNQYEFVYPDQFLSYQQSMARFTGREAYEEYRVLREFLSRYDQENEYLKTEIIPLFSEESVSFLPSVADDDYLRALTAAVNGKSPYDAIIRLETKNEHYAKIRNNYDKLMQYQGFIPFIADLDPNLEYDECYTYLQSHADEILNAFAQPRYQDAFLEMLEAYNFGKSHSGELEKLLPDGFTGTPEERVTVLEAEFTLTGKLADLEKKISESFTDDPADAVISQVLDLLRTLIRYQDSLQFMPDNLSVPAKAVLVRDYRGWFEEHSWESMNLFRDSVICSMVSEASKGNELYHEYFFYHYLLGAGSFTTTDPLTADDIRSVFSKMDEYIAQGMFTEEEAVKYMEILFLGKNSAFSDLYRKDLTTPAIYQELAAVDSHYLNHIKDSLPK